MTSGFQSNRPFTERAGPGAGHGELILGSICLSCLRASSGQVSRSLR